MKKTSIWTEKKVELLKKWYDHYQQQKELGKCDSVFKKVASRIKVSEGAVYKKIGRMGLLKAKWALKYTDK